MREKNLIGAPSLVAFNSGSGIRDLEAVITMPEAALLGRQKESGRRRESGGNSGGVEAPLDVCSLTIINTKYDKITSVTL